MKKIIYFSYLALVLASCGGDNGDNSVVAPEKRSEVSTIYELGACNMQNASESILVLNENAAYFCNGVEWTQQQEFIPSSSNSLEIYPGSANSFYVNVCEQGNSNYLNPNINYDSFYNIWWSAKGASMISDTVYYHTVEIGTQTWMAENMRTSSNLNICGDYYDIFNLFGLDYSYEWCDSPYEEDGRKENIKEKVLRFESYNNSDPYVISGCPHGFHIPSVDEWATLFNVTGLDPRAIQAKGIPFWEDATDQFGLSIIPSGKKTPSSFDIYNIQRYNDSLSSLSAYFWTSTIEINPNYTSYTDYTVGAREFLSIYYVIINKDEIKFDKLPIYVCDGGEISYAEKYKSLSVRCVKN